MATPEEINDKLERLIDLLSSGRFASTATVSDPAKNLKKSFTNLENAIARSNAALKVSEGTLKNQAERQKEVSRLLSREIAAIDERIELLEKEGKVSEANLLREQKREAERNKVALNQKAANKEMIDQVFDLSNVLKIAGTTMVNASTAVGGAMTNLQGTAKATDAAGTLLKAGAGLAGAAAEGLGKGLETAGNSTILASLGMKGFARGATLLAGSLLSAAGIITTKGSPLLVKGFTFFYDFMSREFEALGEGFRRTSSAGALFANGMTGMTNAAGKAGLTLQQFGNVVEKTRDSLIRSGLSVSGAMILLSQTSGVIRAEGNEVGRQLNNLGYTFEEQTSLIAETMGDLGRMGGLAGMSQDEVTAATLDTAKSMKLLAGLAGEDAKARREATRKANDEIAFKSKLLQLENQYGTAYRKKVEDAMAQLDPNVAQMVREIEKYGNIITPGLAIMATNVPAMGDVASQFYNSMKQGSIDSEEALRMQGRANDQIKAQASQPGNIIEIFGLVIKGPAAEVAKAFESTLTQALRMGSEAVERQIKSMNEAANTSDGLTKNYIAAMKANQLAMVMQQQLAMNNMKDFAGLVAEVNEQIINAIKLIKEGLGEKTIWQSIKDNIFNFAGSLLTAVGLFKILKSGGIGGILGKGVAGVASASQAGKVLSADQLRARELIRGGMSVPEALREARRTSGFGGYVSAEQRIREGASAASVPTPATTIPKTTTGAATAAPSALKTGAAAAGRTVLSIGKVVGAALLSKPALIAAGVGLTGYGAYKGYQALTGGRSNGTDATPIEKPVLTGATQQIIERQNTQVTNTIISELSLPTLPLNVNTKEMRDSLLKQVEKMSELSLLNEQMLNQLRENNSLVKQLLSATV